MTVAGFRADWNRFFYEPRDARPLGVFRIAYALLLLVNAAVLWPDLYVFLGAAGFIPPGLQHVAEGVPRFSPLEWLPHTDAVLTVVFAVYVLAAIALLAGFRARIAAAALFFTLVSFHHSDVLIFNSGDTVMRLTAFYLVFVDSGAAYSLPAWLRARRRGSAALEIAAPRVAPLGWRLIQLQTSCIYVFTWIDKMCGVTWANGTATFYTARLEAYWRVRVPYVFEWLPLIHATTWGTLAVELSLGTLIWFRNLRPWVLIAGIGLHLGIELTMRIHLFEWMMVVTLLAFVEPGDLDWIRGLVSRRSVGRVVV